MASIMETSTFPALYWLIPSLILLFIHFYIGAKGNQWLKIALISRGYKKVTLSNQ